MKFEISSDFHPVLSIVSPCDSTSRNVAASCS